MYISLSASLEIVHPEAKYTKKVEGIECACTQIPREAGVVARPAVLTGLCLIQCQDNSAKATKINRSYRQQQYFKRVHLANSQSKFRLLATEKQSYPCITTGVDFRMIIECSACF